MTVDISDTMALKTQSLMLICLITQVPKSREARDGKTHENPEQNFLHHNFWAVSKSHFVVKLLQKNAQCLRYISGPLKKIVQNFNQIFNY